MMAMHDNRGACKSWPRCLHIYIQAQLGISVGQDTTGEGYGSVVIKFITLKFVNGLLINTAHFI